MPSGRSGLMCASSGSDRDSFWTQRPPAGKYGVFDDASEEEGYGRVLWNSLAKGELVDRPVSGARTCLEILQKAQDKYGDKECAGVRQVNAVHMVPDKTGTKWEKLELENAYTWLSYKDYGARVRALSSGFVKALNLELDSKVVLYAETQRDWLVTAFATWFCRCSVVTIYSTLGPDAATYGINETEAPIVVADAKLIKTIGKILPSCPLVKHVVALGTCDAMTATQFAECGGGRRLHVAGELIRSNAGDSYDIPPVVPEDRAIIMYTSGTTGTPKGVVVSHGNIVAAVGGTQRLLLGTVGNNERYLAYLPLAHVLEIVCELQMIGLGMALGYGSPQTLLSVGDASKKLFNTEIKQSNPEFKPKVGYSLGDAPVLQPTLLVFPPAVMEKIYKNVTAKLQASRLGWLLQKGLQRGEEARQNSDIGAGLFSGALFRAVASSLLGSCPRMILTGSAPISPEVLSFVQTVFGCPVRQGYGLTETTAASFMAAWSDFNPRSVGPPSHSTVIRLADWKEGGYMNADAKDPAIGMPRGEVLIAGPGVCSEYYINPNSPNEELVKKNEEDFVTIQGMRFFRTGDIGQVSAAGTLEIIDRKKDLWKGPNGEYVSFGKVEQVLKLCEYVALPMVYARTGKSYAVALLCVIPSKIKSAGAQLGVSGSLHQLCKDNQIVNLVSKECHKVCTDKKLAAFEIPKKFALIAEMWTPENELLTAAMKMKRPVIAQHHKEDIDRLYA